MKNNISVYDIMKALPLNEDANSVKSKRAEFEKLHREFLKSATKEELLELYEARKKECGSPEEFDPSFCTLYLYAWELIPACHEKAPEARKKQILREMQRVLEKNMSLCSEGVLGAEDKFLILEILLGIFKAEWTKRPTVFPAILHYCMTNEKNENIAQFYGQDAKDFIEDYFLRISNLEDLKALIEAETAPGVVGEFEAKLHDKMVPMLEQKKECTKRYYDQIYGNKEDVDAENAVTKEEEPVVELPVVEEEPSLVEKTKVEEPKVKELFIKKHGLLIAVILCIISLFIALSSLQDGRGTSEKDIAQYIQDNEDLKEEIEILKKEVEDLKESMKKQDERDEPIEDAEENEGADVEVGNGVTISTDVEAEFPVEYTLEDTYNLRKECNTDSDIVRKVASGTVVTVLEEEEEDWYRVELPNGKTGYLFLEEFGTE